MFDTRYLLNDALCVALAVGTTSMVWAGLMVVTGSRYQIQWWGVLWLSEGDLAGAYQLSEGEGHGGGDGCIQGWWEGHPHSTQQTSASSLSLT